MADYDQIIKNINQMISVLEIDGTRSPGKIKINASTLVDLHNLLDIYQAKLPKKTPATTQAKGK